MFHRWLHYFGLPLLFLALSVQIGEAAIYYNSVSPAAVGVDGQYFEATSTFNTVVRIPVFADSQGDTLQTLTVINEYFDDDMPADDSMEIVTGSVRLWYMAADTEQLNTTTAQLVGSMTYTTSRMCPGWILGGLSWWVENGSSLYVTIDITSDPSPDTACRFQVPTGRLLFASGTPPFSDPKLPIQPPRLLVTPYLPVNFIQASHANSGQIILSTGQPFKPMTLTFTNPGPPLTAPYLTGLTLTVLDADGNPLAPSSALDVLGVRDADTGMLLSQVSSLPASPGACFLPLSVSVTAVEQLRLEVFGIICANTATAVSAFRLECSAADQVTSVDFFSLRPVEVQPLNDTFPMQSNLFSIQLAAERLSVEHTPVMAQNEVVIKGQTNVNPLNFTFRNPGNTGTARVDVTRITLPSPTPPA